MRYIFRTPVINRDGLYQYQPLSLEQVGAWLADGPDPLFRLPLIGSVVQTLTGRKLPVHPSERFFLHTGDEALITIFDFPEDRSKPGYRRGQVATTARSLTLAELRESVQFGLLRKFARMDGYTQSITCRDAAHRNRRWRSLVHDAILVEYGIYEFARCEHAEAQHWLDEGPYESKLRYDATCKALEVLFVECDITLWETNSRASLSMHPGDQSLVVYFHSPEDKPKPFEPYTGTLSLEYVRAHTNLSFLTRLSDEFVQRNSSAFPMTVMVPGEMRVG